MLMTGSGISPGRIQPPAAQFAASPPIVPVPFSVRDSGGPFAAVLSPGDQSKNGILRPGGEIVLDRISVGAATGNLWLELTWNPLPRGTAGELSVFDEKGRLLADSSTAAGADCCIVELSGPISTPDSVLYVAARIIEPAAAVGDPLPGTSYHLQIESEPPEAASPGSNPEKMTADSIMMGTTGRASGSLQRPLPHLSAGVTSPGPGPGPGPSIGTPGGDLVPAVSASGISTAADTAAGDGGTAPTMEAPLALNAPVAVNPLPASSYEPAGGIFEVAEAADRDDRDDKTRVEMSLVRIVSPGREESFDDRWSSHRDPTTQPDAISGSSDDVAQRRGALAPDWSMEPGGEIPLVVAAILLPIDERDRPATSGTRVRRGVSADGEPWDGLGGAIILGVSSSAVLGSALYAPDVTAVMHRARPHSRARAVGRREEG